MSHFAHNLTLADFEATRNVRAVAARSLKAALNRDRHNPTLFDATKAAFDAFNRGDDDYRQAARSALTDKAAELEAALAAALDYLLTTGPDGSALVEAYLRATAELRAAHEAESRYSCSDLDLEALGPRPSPMSPAF